MSAADPGAGIATTVKARAGNKVLAPVDQTATTPAPQGVPEAALDHDFAKAKMTPSVILQISPLPRKLTDSRVTGHVTVNVMDSVFVPSTGWVRAWMPGRVCG